MTKRVAILQSSYIPWKGYFDIIHDVDEFIFHDDLQYTKQDWRNRNRIMTARGPVWLTIPVGSNEKRLIRDVELPEASWARRHWLRILEWYRRAPHFDTYRPSLEQVYLGTTWRYLSELNQSLIRTIARDFLGSSTRFRDTSELALHQKREDRVLEILEQVGADVYVSGPAAKRYLTENRFADAGIRLEWKDYGGYPEYAQFYPPFVHEVTILDLLFHTGPEAPKFIWGWRTQRT